MVLSPFRHALDLVRRSASFTSRQSPPRVGVPVLALGGVAFLVVVRVASTMSLPSTLTSTPHPSSRTPSGTVSVASVGSPRTCGDAAGSVLCAEFLARPDDSAVGSGLDTSADRVGGSAAANTVIVTTGGRPDVALKTESAITSVVTPTAIASPISVTRPTIVALSTAVPTQVSTTVATVPAATATSSAGTTPSPVPTASSAGTPVAPAVARGSGSAKSSVATVAPPVAAVSVLQAPFHSQFDGSVWAPTNCGPTSLSMALGALKISADQISLRHLANVQMHTNTTRGGTSWEALAYAAKANGASVQGLTNGTRYRNWTFDDVKTELSQGHPVLLLVRYQYLPDHAQSTFRGDHYVVALRVNAQGNLVYNDPAFRTADGAGRTIGQSALMRAWTGTAEGLVRTAMALTAKS